jgi:hypothetical protein
MQAHAHERILFTEAALRVKDGEKRARLMEVRIDSRLPLKARTLLTALVHRLSL